MKKNLFSKAAATLFAVSMAAAMLAGCGGSSNAEAPASGAKTEAAGEQKAASGSTKVWRMAFNQTEDHPQYRVMEEFSKEFKEKTDGRYEIQLFPNETLGAQRETLEQVQSGVIEMSIVNNTHPGSVSDYFKAFDMPFLFDNVDEAIKFVKESPVMETVKSDTEQYGFRIATYMPAGTRSMFTAKTPIKSVDDMKGLKIRTMESDIYVNMMNAFGGSATPMAMGEMYTAIQSGVVDGAENNEITYVNSKYYEVAPFWSQTNHLIVPDWLIINKDVYYSMSEEDRAVFDQLCSEAIDKVQVQWQADVDKLMASLDTSKVTITDDVDIESFKAAIAPTNEKLVAENAKIKEVYDAVQAMK
ncbi:MAG: TRAP transporter substrate-binding protein [Lachnospiraceae bacterium]|nr:TRAP transporter substrate-binding protein [Lachnospiraceae bacterium]